MSETLKLRDWQEGDMPLLAEMHRKMEVGYQLPENFGPLYCVRKAIIDENGKVIAMAALRLTCEAYFWQDSSHSVIKLARAIGMLNGECAKEAARLGLEDASAWIPEKIGQYFSKTLEKLGWRRSPWPNWSVILK